MVKRLRRFLVQLKRILNWLWFWIRRFQWVIYGLLYFLFWWLCISQYIISRCIGLTHSTDVSNYYIIAWTYVTLVVAIISLAYPFSLNIRESLTTRLFKAHDKLKDTMSNNDLKKLFQNEYEVLRKFRRALFDRQLPFIASFCGCSILRILFCLINVGPFPITQQIIEPQIYMVGFMFCAASVASTFLKWKPFYAIEKLEAEIRGLPPFELRDVPSPSLDPSESKD